MVLAKDSHEELRKNQKGLLHIDAAVPIKIFGCR